MCSRVLREGLEPFVSSPFSCWKHVEFKRAELGSQVDFPQVVLGYFICIPVRLMCENSAIYLERLRLTRQIMFSYRPFISQMSTVCFLELSFYVLDTELCLRQTGQWSGWVISGLLQ